LEAASVHVPAGLHRVSVPLLRLRSDEQLLALFRQGDEDAFQVIHERYRQRLFAYARQMLGGSRSDAEDAMQDVFLRAYGALRADDRPVTLRAWLYRVAHNRCIDQLRRPLPAAVDLFDLTRGPSLQDPLEQAERREDLRRLVTDVRRLPEQQRSALLMREMEGLTYKELSEALAVSIPAVKSLLVRARIGLVEAIEARDTACCGRRDEL
jgi:RNA polymerase sigma factor (sigma-70 family)